MPFTQVVESVILMVGLEEESVQRFGMIFWATDKVCLATSLIISRQTDNSEMTWSNLLPH